MNMMKMVFYTKDIDMRPKPSYPRIYNKDATQTPTARPTPINNKALSLKAPVLNNANIGPLKVTPMLPSSGSLFKSSMIDRVMNAKSGCSACGK
jgi:hypothetical protein